MTEVFEWIKANWMWLIPAVVAAMSAINKATVHWSTLTGPWYRRALPVAILLVTELASVLTSKGVPGLLKAPLTTKPPRKDIFPREPTGPNKAALMLLGFAAATGCASWQLRTKQAATAVAGAAFEAKTLARPLLRAKCLRETAPCTKLAACKTAKEVCDGKFPCAALAACCPQLRACDARSVALAKAVAAVYLAAAAALHAAEAGEQATAVRMVQRGLEAAAQLAALVAKWRQM